MLYVRNWKGYERVKKSVTALRASFSSNAVHCFPEIQFNITQSSTFRCPKQLMFSEQNIVGISYFPMRVTCHSYPTFQSFIPLSNQFPGEEAVIK